MPGAGHDVIVLGTAAGGMEALDELFGQLPRGLPAAILVVQHMAPDSAGEFLLRRLQRHQQLKVMLAEHGVRVLPGRAYLAPPDHHLLLKNNRILITKGARENRNRPGIDPLFRSAAVAFGRRVIGVVLTGLLDDGTAGLTAIRKCGGITVAQEPNDAAYSSMPQSAVDHGVDYCVPIREMGALLVTLVSTPAGKRRSVPADVRTEAVIAERVMSDIAQVNRLGTQVPYNCPNCGGVLWKLDTDGRRYRCHTGHSFTSASLLVSQSEKIDEMLWISLRMFEERKNLLNTMLKTAVGAGRKRPLRQRANQTQGYIDRIRGMLLAPGSHDAADTLTHVRSIMAEPRRARSAR